MTSQDELIEKYKKRLSDEFGTKLERKEVLSSEYVEFKKSFMPKTLSYYEKACAFAEKIIKITPDKKSLPKLQRSINIAHLNISPGAATSFAIVYPMVLLIIGALISLLLFNSVFLLFVILVVAAGSFFFFSQYPVYLANNWRIKASNQMVQCVFYVVTYMRHTSNLERAVEFASDHVGLPLSLDMRRVLWQVESGKYSNIREALDVYLDTWKDWNMEFIESFHLIMSSLFETSDARRVDLLDKALDVILSETYEKMLHYAQNLKGPMTMLHMMGIILPILGLVILPLVVSFVTGENASPMQVAFGIALLYNFLLPAGIFVFGKVIMSKRPSGYGTVDIAEQDESVKKKENIIFNLGGEVVITPRVIALTVAFVFLLIGLSPLILHIVNPTFDLEFMGGSFQLLGYTCPSSDVCDPSDMIGPFGLGAGILSFFVVLAFGIGLSIYYGMRARNVIKIRNESKALENEFSSALFQLGNRLADGLPAEIAFGRVGESLSSTTSGRFCNVVSQNITRMGMSVEQAIFDPHVGAVRQFPSRIIESSMKVLIESMKKGPMIAAQALLSIARYIKEIHRVDERLKDLLADIISSMKSQIAFLTPAIAGIVIGITSMITSILGKLSSQLGQLTEGEGAVTGAAGLTQLFGRGVPTFYFQIIVGIYVVEIVYLLTGLSSAVENGEDKLTERFLLGKNLKKSTLLYVFIAMSVMLFFNMISSQIMSASLG